MRVLLGAMRPGRRSTRDVSCGRRASVRATGAALCVLAFGCASNAPAPRAASGDVRFPTGEGLEPAHRDVRPVAEVVHCDLPHSPCRGTRVYPDGTVYLVQGEAGPYVRLTTLRPEGLPALEAELACACTSDVVPRPGPTGHGRSVHRVATPRCMKEVVLYGVEAGPYACLHGFEDTVRAHLVPIVPAAPVSP